MTYLDTHIVVWLYQGSLKRLSREAARLIDRAEDLLISPAVELELEYLQKRKRVSTGPRVILSELQARIGLAFCELPFAMVTHEALSIGWTDDVFDRLIVAQASATASPLITADEAILDNYPQAVW